MYNKWASVWQGGEHKSSLHLSCHERREGPPLHNVLIRHEQNVANVPKLSSRICQELARTWPRQSSFKRHREGRGVIRPSPPITTQHPTPALCPVHLQSTPLHPPLHPTPIPPPPLSLPPLLAIYCAICKSHDTVNAFR